MESVGEPVVINNVEKTPIKVYVKRLLKIVTLMQKDYPQKKFYS